MVDRLCHLHQCLTRGRGPYALPALASLCNTDCAQITIDRIGHALPALPSAFIALAATDSTREGRAAVVFPVDGFQHIVNTALNRTDLGYASALPSFDRGVFIQIAALAVADIMRAAGWDGQIHGVLDSPRQLQLFFLNAPDRTQYMETRLSLGCQTFPCLMLGNVTFTASRRDHAPGPGHYPDGLPIDFNVVIGHTTLSAACCRTLAPGDAVTIDELSLPPRLLTGQIGQGSRLKNGIRLYSGYFALAAEWMNQDDIQIKDTLTMGDSNELTQTQLTGDVQDVGDAEIPCSIELTNLRMTVAEASSLLPGQILKLNRTINDIVCLMADGRVLCKGQLVEIENQLALEITEVP